MGNTYNITQKTVQRIEINNTRLILYATNTTTQLIQKN